MSVLCEPRLTKRTETKRFHFFPDNILDHCFYRVQSWSV